MPCRFYRAGKFPKADPTRSTKAQGPTGLEAVEARMNRREVVESATKAHPEPPANMSEADELAWILARVLDWGLPGGTIREYALPKWLSRQADESLERYIARGAD
jgi:hypothetical protein